MKAVFCRISELADQHESRPLFRLLEGSARPPEVQVLVSALTFFVFAFQDVLRLNEKQMVDPALKAIARQHRAEDAGHQRWFLHDARRLGVEPDIEWAFGREHRVTRDTSYRLIAEVFRASDDRVRVLVPLVLEAAGHPFFSRVFRFFENAGVSGTFKYFARTHWEVEESHAMLQQDQGRLLHELQLPDDLRAECHAMIERMFQAMGTLVDDLWRRMVAAQAEHPDRRAVPNLASAALD